MRRFAIPLLVWALLLVAAQSAVADHHLMKVSELMLSSGGNPAAQFVELRDDFDEPFPASLEPYKVVVYDGAGARVGAQELSPNPFSSRDNTQPFLIASDATGLGAVRDAALTVALPTAAGHVCFTRQAIESRVHCVAYGCPAAPLSGSQVGRAPGDGQSLQRTASGLAIGSPTPKATNAAAGSASCSGGGGTTPPAGGGTQPPGSGGGEVQGEPGAPVPRLSGRRRQDVDRLAVRVRVDEPATIVVKATVKVPGATRIVRFKTVRRGLEADVRRSIRLRLSARARRSVKRALGRGARLTARIVVTARDADGNSSRRVRRVRLTN